MILSIIIPAIDEAENVARAVDSALACGAAEAIVVDGGSRDATATLAAERGARVVSSAPGRAIQQNAGAELAVGDVLLFLHADNWLDPDAGRQISECMASDDVVAGAFDQSIDAPGRRYRLLERGNAARVKMFSIAYGDQAIFVRRSDFDGVSGFPQAAIMEDLLLMRRLRRRGRVVLLAGPVHLSARRWQERGVVRQTLRNWSLLTAHRLGASPERLARHYPKHAAVQDADDAEPRGRRDQGE